MTKSSQVHGWPIAESTDVVKQYPATIDEPFKVDLDRNVPIAFVDTAERDLNLPTPRRGQVCFIEAFQQFQMFNDVNGWLPLSGNMSHGQIGEGTSQSVSADVYTKLTFTGEPDRITGDVTWDGSRNCFIGPVGLWIAQLTFTIASAGSSGTLTSAFGTGDAYGSAADGFYIASGQSTVMGSQQVRYGFEIAGYVKTDVARSFSAKTLSVTYLTPWSSPPVA